MKANKWYLIGFVGMVILQWMIPAGMISRSEKALQSGKPFKFEIAPVDPNDPFRGKYVVLSYRANTLETDVLEIYREGQPVYVTIREGDDGFAEIARISRLEPEGTDAYTAAKVAGVSVGLEKGEQTVTVDYPFDRYYVNEKKASEIEKAYQKAAGENDPDTYAVVRLRKGRGLLEDLIINGTSVNR